MNGGQASDDVLAMASLEVELANIEPGQTITVKWRGKPVFVRRRTAKEIEIAAEPVSGLRDPQDDSERAVNPEVCIPSSFPIYFGSKAFRGRLYKVSSF